MARPPETDSWSLPPEDRQRPPVILERECRDKEVVIHREDIQRRVQEMAQEIAQDYKGKDLVLLGLLKGAFIFTSDLARALNDLGVNVRIELPAASTYQERFKAGKPRIGDIDKREINGKDVLVVDDVLDSGKTINKLLNELQTKFSPASLRTAFIVNKTQEREVPFQGDYIGFLVNGNPWLEGYGMDSFGLGRGNPDIIARVNPSNPASAEIEVYDAAAV